MAKASEVLIYIKDKLSISGLKSLPDVVNSVTQRIKGAFNALALGAVAGLTAAFWQLTKSVKDFAAQELGETDLSSALKQMGQDTDGYRQKLVELANQYQTLTNIGDEVWLKTFAQLTRFGATSDNIDQVAEATKNLAALMDGNLQGAALAMQRALEGEFSMFSRYGITLDLTGDKVKDLDSLMTALSEKGGGLLEARAQTLSGRFAALKNAVGDFREEVGRTLAESLGLKDGLDAVIAKFGEWQESAKTGKIHEIIKAAAERVREFAELIAGIVQEINSLQDLKVLAESIGDWLKIKLKEGGVEAAKFILSKAPSIGATIGNAVKDAIFNRSQDNKEAAARTNAELGTRSGGFFSREYRERKAENLEIVRAERLEAEGRALSSTVELSENSMQSFADIFYSNLAKSDQAARVDELASMLASGMSADEIDAVIRSWELNQEDLAALMDSLGDSADASASAVDSADASAKAVEEMQTAAGKTLDAATQASAALRTSMEQVSADWQQSKRVAERSISIGEQQLDATAQLLSKVQMQADRISALEFQIRSLKS
ncbi:hypothetical protein EGM51_10565 [Verrucomicrobia bacterium S94]|nr:hypothetical protein EGM51_10565 [Verrucomicrobia bacterium S94]